MTDVVEWKDAAFGSCPRRKDSDLGMWCGDEATLPAREEKKSA